MQILCKLFQKKFGISTFYAVIMHKNTCDLLCISPRIVPPFQELIYHYTRVLPDIDVFYDVDSKVLKSERHKIQIPLSSKKIYFYDTTVKYKKKSDDSPPAEWIKYNK